MGEVINLFDTKGEDEPGTELDFAKTRRLLETLTSIFKTQPNLRNNIPSRLEYLAKTSDDELVRALNLSEENDWKQRPAYYGAIVDRLRKSGII
jgi:hypothetical protein